MKRAGGLLLALTLVALTVVVLRETTRTVHTAVPTGARTEVEVVAYVRQEHPEARRDLTSGLVELCRARVGTGLADPGLETVAPGRYRFALEPGLDEFNRREMHGCLEDARLQHLELDVLRLETVVPPARGADTHPTGHSPRTP